MKNLTVMGDVQASLGFRCFSSHVCTTAAVILKYLFSPEETSLDVSCESHKMSSLIFLEIRNKNILECHLLKFCMALLWCLALSVKFSADDILNYFSYFFLEN